MKRPVLSSRDKRLLQAAQDDLPLVPRPYRVIARRCGMSEEEVLVRLNVLERQGIVRYAGVIFNMDDLNVVTSLIAMRVPRGRLRKVARVISRCPNVGHNYQRTGEYNLWFTLSASSERKFSRLLKEIQQETGIKDILDLRAERLFKRRAVFKL